MTEEIKEILDDYKKLAGEITEKLDNTAEYESWLIIQDYVDEFLNYITNLQKENNSYKQRNEKAIDELFELKNMIYKPETREENFEIQRKISSIIKKLGLGGDE